MILLKKSEDCFITFLYDAIVKLSENLTLKLQITKLLDLIAKLPFFNLKLPKKGKVPQAKKHRY